MIAAFTWHPTFPYMVKWRLAAHNTAQQLLTYIAFLWIYQYAWPSSSRSSSNCVTIWAEGIKFSIGNHGDYPMHDHDWYDINLKNVTPDLSIWAVIKRLHHLRGYWQSKHKKRPQGHVNYTQVGLSGKKLMHSNKEESSTTDVIWAPIRTTLLEHPKKFPNL